MVTQRGRDMLNDITALIKQFEPESLLPTPEKRPRRSRAGAGLGSSKARPDGHHFRVPFSALGARSYLELEFASEKLALAGAGSFLAMIPSGEARNPGCAASAIAPN